MKKLLLSIITAGIVTVTYSQKTYFTTFIQSASRSTGQGKWVWNPRDQVRMMITMEDYDIYLDNNVKTHIHIISEGDTKKIKGGEITIYDAIDQNKIKCTWSILTWEDKSPNQLMLSYSKATAMYTMSLD